MAIEDLIARGITPPTYTDPLDEATKASNLRSAAINQQIGQQGLASGALDLQLKQASMARLAQANQILYGQPATGGAPAQATPQQAPSLASAAAAPALPTDAQGNSIPNVAATAGGMQAPSPQGDVAPSPAGYGSAAEAPPAAAPGVMTPERRAALIAIPEGQAMVEAYDKAQESGQALAKAKAENDLLAANALGRAAAGVRAAGYSMPALQSLALTIAKAGHPDQAQALLQHVGNDPSRVQGVVDQLIAQSPDQVKEDSEKTTADARMLASQQEKAKTDAQLPGMIAESSEKQRRNAASVLAASMPPGPARDAVLRAGMAPDAITTADETRRRDAQTAANENTRNAILGGELDIKRKTFDATFGAGLDANGHAIPLDQQVATAKADPSAVAIAQYQIPPPATATRGGLPSPMMRKVMLINPNYQASRYQANNATALDFAPSGASGKQLTSTDVALGHLGAVSAAGKALDNGQIPVLNHIANELGVQVGQSPKVTYDTIVSMVAPEISKAVIGEAGGEGERTSMKNNFSSSSPTSVRESAISGAVSLLAQRFKKNKNAYEQQMGMPLPRTLSPESQAVLDQYQGAGGHKVGDTVNYRGTPHKITAIVNGQLVLDGTQ